MPLVERPADAQSLREAVSHAPVTLLTPNPSYWSTHDGAELDLRLEVGGRVLGFEIKRTSQPAVSKSMHSALADLHLDHLFLVHAGPHRFPLTDQITAISATELLTHEDPLNIS